MEGQREISVIKADDIKHILRDGIVLIPGSRDRDGHSLLILKPRETPANADHLRNVLLYIHTVAIESEKGYSVVVDMRGRCKWDAVKPMLKALNHLTERTSAVVHLVLIIRPDSFWDKQKAQMAHSLIKSAEVHFVSVESLIRFFDSSQLTRDLGGNFPFDYDDWLDTRLELEGWIWRVSEWMRSLEECRRKIADALVPTCVNTAETALNEHVDIQKRILAVPIDKIDRDSVLIKERIRKGEQRGGDLDASVPHMGNMVTSLITLKNDVFEKWQRRREELKESHNSKLLERDAEGLLGWMKTKADCVLRDMTDIGDGIDDTQMRLTQLMQLEESIRNADINVHGVNSCASRVKTGAKSAIMVADEYNRLVHLISKRRHLLTCAITFERAERAYASEWKEWCGVKADELTSRDDRAIREGMERNEELWKAADESYINALDAGNKLSHAWKAADCSFGEKKTKERLARIATHHRNMGILYKEGKKELSLLTAFDAFQHDLRRVFDWLEQHGEPYLRKNTGIGEEKAQASHLRQNHLQFREIAKGTYENAKKLFEVGHDCLQSGLFNEDVIRSLLSQLEKRIMSFEGRVEKRLKILNSATLFFTHHEELLNWYEEMERKYTAISVDTEVSQCEHEKKQWILESDGTAQAYTTTVAEGNELVMALEEETRATSTDREKTTIDKLRRMLGEIDERNSELMGLWKRQRPAMQFGLKVALLLSEIQDLVEQMQSWEDDMKTLIKSGAFLENAEKVIPYHKENQEKVRRAIDKTRSEAKETLQLMRAHGLEELCTLEGERVEDAIIRKFEQLEGIDVKVMMTAGETTRRLEGAKRALLFRQFCIQLMEACSSCEKKIHDLSAALPTNLNDAARMTNELTFCQKEFERREMERAQLYRNELDEVLRNGVVQRNKVLEWNQEVNRSLERLNLFFNDRHRALKAGTDFFKTYDHIEPILLHLEKEYTCDCHVDWCSLTQANSSTQKAKCIAEQVSAHIGVREKFQKGCTYAQKTSDLFLKYINRCIPSAQQRECAMHVQRLRTTVREQQARILELWAKKKKELDRCHQYQLLEATREQLTEWINQEAYSTLKDVRISSGQERINRLNAFTVVVKEHRAEIQLMVNTGEVMVVENERHREDVAKSIRMMKDAYECLATQLSQLETTKIDELSLDRRSDTNIEARMEEAKKMEKKNKGCEPMRELLQTERIYIEDLRRCIQVYVTAFDEMELKGEVPPLIRSRRAELFGNIEDIYSFHSSTFLSALEKYEREPELVGYSFTVYVGTLSELYTSYCAHKDQDATLLHMKETRLFFEKVREEKELESSNSLDSLLIRPVQRITRYALLMGQLCKNGVGETIKDALEVVTNIPKRANDICHLNYIDMKDKEKLTHAGPLVCQDSLTVWESRSLIKGKGKERQVFLFELAIAMTKKVVEAGNNRVRYLLKHKPIALSDVSSVVEHVEGDRCLFALRLGEVGTNENRIEMKASCESAKMGWIRRLRECIHQEELVTLKLELDNRTGGWIRDECSSSQMSNDKRSSVQSTSSAEQGGETAETANGEDENDVSPDRPCISSPQPNHSSQSKRKSLRRIFSHSSRPSQSPDRRKITVEEEGIVEGGNSVLSEVEIVEKRECQGNMEEEGLPPPMEELSAIQSKDEEKICDGNGGIQEKSKEEIARFKRQYVLMELVETEKDYIKDLGSVVEGYMAEMQEKDLPEDLQGKDKIIFANISQIHEFHKTCFLREIEKCLEDYNHSALPFVKYERRLHTLYVKYCQNKPKSDFLVAQDAFEQYFADTKARLGHKVALCDLLIKPVQRIMKYQLLLKDIVKFTERAGDSTATLKKALDVMHVVPKACDDMMQVGRLQNFDGNLNAQGKLLHQGTVLLCEQGTSMGVGVKSKERRMFLFEQSAIIADCILPKKEFANPTYIFKNQIMVNKMILDGCVADCPLSFIIRSSDQGTSFTAQCTNEDEKNEWIAKISLQLDQQKTLLAALVDPKRYQSQLSGGVAGVSLDGEEKKNRSGGGSTGFISRFKTSTSGSNSAPVSVSSTTPKAESPKHTATKTKSSLFNFGKKTKGQSSTSPPVVGHTK